LLTILAVAAQAVALQLALTARTSMSARPVAEAGAAAARTPANTRPAPTILSLMDDT
jgi:hypothetical protein